MTLNFKEMSKEQLIAYVKKHRTDDEAIRELFINRRNPDTKIYPYEMNQEEIKQVLVEKILESEG